MNTSDWKELRKELENRGFSISIKGRSRSEMIAESDHIIVDVYKKGITGSGTRPEIYIFDIEGMQVIDHFEEFYLSHILNRVDSFLSDYE